MKQTGGKNPEQEGEDQRRGTERGINWKRGRTECQLQTEIDRKMRSKRMDIMKDSQEGEKGGSLVSCSAASYLHGERVMQKKTAGKWGRSRSRCSHTLEEMDEMTQPAKVSWRKLVCEWACWSLKYNRSCILIETGSIGWTLNKRIKTYGMRGFEEPSASLIWKMKGPSESREVDPWR